MANEDKVLELMTQMYSEFKGFKSEMLEFKKDVTEKVSSMDEKVSSMDGKISSMDEKVSFMDGKISSLDEKVSSINKAVIKIENEHGTKLSALFDGWKQNTDQLYRIEKEVSRQDEVILRKIK
jgi:peptidoglycan hydrolase CwlO-like protein